MPNLLRILQTEQVGGQHANNSALRKALRHFDLVEETFYGEDNAYNNNNNNKNKPGFCAFNPKTSN